MKKLSIPEYCKGCLALSTLGVLGTKYSVWCCASGKPAVNNIGHCKLHNLKRISTS